MQSDSTGRGETPRVAARRWARITAGFALVIGAGLLACWLSRDPGAIAFASPRGKTNTCLANVSLAVALLALLRPKAARWAIVSACGAGLAFGVGVATLLEYATTSSWGIDEWVARDIWSAESVGLPNRMSPLAALNIALLGAAVLLLRRRRLDWARVAQALALSVLIISAIALTGYLYSASFLYQPTRFIRISAYTAVAQSALSFSVMLAKPRAGMARAAFSPTVGGYLSRRLLPFTIVVPVLIGWFFQDLSERGSLVPSEAHALHSVAVVAALVGLVLFLARSLDGLELKRDLVTAYLRRSHALTSGLARARTVDEVVDVTMRLSRRALSAKAVGILVLTEDQRQLRTLGTRGYPTDLVERFNLIDINAPLPVATAVRTRRAVFLATVEDRRKEFPELPLVDGLGAWAALPLEGGAKVLGALVASFAPGETFDHDTRNRVRQLAWQCGQALDRALLFESEQRARRSAEGASRAKDEFLALLGHELRNPLSPIVTSLQVMKIRAPGVLERERGVIERQVLHMRRLVDDLLDVPRITSGRIELRRNPTDLQAVVSAALEVASPLIDQRKHHVELDVATGLVVDVDAARFIQVISNLLTNAAKYTDPGGHLLVRGKLDGSTVVLEVSDNGTGIHPELLPHVFELFVQGRRTIDRSDGGLGLGLALVKSLVELHGGEVAAASEGPGQGTRITVRLPLSVAKDASIDATPAPPRVGTTPRQRVLIVDDNRDAADTAAEAITLSGHDVRVAYDGPSALAAARELRPTVAFLDLGLPVMDGFELARRLREPETRMTLVAVTGYGQEVDRARSAAAGFDEHLTKPVALDDLLVLIDLAARRASVGADGQRAPQS